VSQAASAGLLEEYMSLPEKCPVCNTPWTTTRLVFSDIKHCKKCDAKAEDIMAKHKESEENINWSLHGLRNVRTGYSSDITSPYIAKVETYSYDELKEMFPPKTKIKVDGEDKEVYTEELFKGINMQEYMEKQRNIREEIDALYEKRKKNGMYDKKANLDAILYGVGTQLSHYDMWQLHLEYTKMWKVDENGNKKEEL